MFVHRLVSRQLARAVDEHCKQYKLQIVLVLLLLTRHMGGCVGGTWVGKCSGGWEGRGGESEENISLSLYPLDQLFIVWKSSKAWHVDAET